MLNYAETASSSTIVPVESVPCLLLQEDSITSSYALGPIDPAQVIAIQAPLSTGDVCPLLVPVHLPSAISSDPAFRDGYEWNYLSEEEGDKAEWEAWTSSVPRLVNHIHSLLTDTRLYRNFETGEVLPDVLPWQVGWVLRDLTRLAQTDRTLAYVGLRHLCFLLPPLTQHRPITWPPYEIYDAGILHDHAVKAYRAQVRSYREQGKSFEQAQRLALR